MKTILNVKIDRHLKESASNTAREMGLPMSTVVGNLLRRFTEDKMLTFEAPLKPTKRLIKSIRQGQKDLREGRMSPLFVNMDKMDKYLAGL